MNTHHIIKKIQVVSPSRLRTGGPESLHNLVLQINRLSIPCELVYFPFHSQYTITEGYEKYAKAATDLDDSDSTLIIIPETLCMIGFAVKKAKIAIWWLSVDNFFQTKYHSPRDYFRYHRLSIRRHRPFLGISSLKNFIHFSKCKYDEDLLDAHSIQYSRLTGPISDDFIGKMNTQFERKNIILYNPKKGFGITQKLIRMFPNLVFQPLENLSNFELINLFGCSKIYIDFGNHPGKERMPREAVALGCCIITGTLGSAKNNEDIPIPPKFKLDTSSSDFLIQFEKRVFEIFDDFDGAVSQFNQFKREIEHEPQNQINDLLTIFKSLQLDIK